MNDQQNTPQASAPSQPVKNKRRPTVLDALFIMVIIGWLTVGAIFLLTTILCAGQGAGCGDIFLLAIFPLLGIGILSVAYPVAVIVSMVIALYRHAAIDKRHILGLVVTVALGLIPYIGPLWLLKTYFGLGS